MFAENFPQRLASGKMPDGNIKVAIMCWVLAEY